MHFRTGTVSRLRHLRLVFTAVQNPFLFCEYSRACVYIYACKYLFGANWSSIIRADPPPQSIYFQFQQYCEFLCIFNYNRSLMCWLCYDIAISHHMDAEELVRWRGLLGTFRQSQRRMDHWGSSLLEPHNRWHGHQKTPTNAYLRTTWVMTLAQPRWLQNTQTERRYMYRIFE